MHFYYVCVHLNLSARKDSRIFSLCECTFICVRATLVYFSFDRATAKRRSIQCSAILDANRLATEPAQSRGTRTYTLIAPPSTFCVSAFQKRSCHIYSISNRQKKGGSFFMSSLSLNLPFCDILRTLKIHQIFISSPWYSFQPCKLIQSTSGYS